MKYFTNIFILLLNMPCFLTSQSYNGIYGRPPCYQLIITFFFSMSSISIVKRRCYIILHHYQNSYQHQENMWQWWWFKWCFVTTWLQTLVLHYYEHTEVFGVSTLFFHSIFTPPPFLKFITQLGMMKKSNRSKLQQWMSLLIGESIMEIDYS